MSLIVHRVCLLERVIPAKLHLLQTRHSVWPKEYVEPLPPNRQFIQQMEEKGETKELSFKPIKPAEIFQPCSVLYDQTLTKFINKAMLQGKRAMMRYLMEDCFRIIKRIQLEK